MKNLILFFFLLAGFTVQAQEKQSLKDLLYAGKLKKDSSGVIHKTDDLSAKIDTSTKKEVLPEKTKSVTPPAQVKKETSSVINQDAVVERKDSSVAAPIAPVENVVPTKTNTKLWKEYNDSLVKIIKAEALSSKQIKKDTYFLLFDYEIGTDGIVNVTNITSTPDNTFLKSQVRQALDSNPLRLNPVLDGSGKAQKVKRKQNLMLTKE